MKKMNLSRSLIPNAITALNILCGFLSFTFASQNDFQLAAAMIGLAALFDLIDGLIARLLKISSQFGVELDSLADAISFGAAPAFLIYKSYLSQFGFIGILISSFLLIFGTFRLARFNTQLEDITIKVDFKGLPIPISAITVASFVYSFNETGNITEPYSFVVIPLILILSILMVSNIRYDTLPKLLQKSLTEKFVYSIFFIAGSILVLITAGKALFFVIVSLILLGVIRTFIHMLISGNGPEEINIKEEVN